MLVSHYFEVALGMKGSCGVSMPREVKFLRSIEPFTPAPSIGDGDGELRHQQEQPPSLVAEASGRSPLRRSPVHARLRLLLSWRRAAAARDDKTNTLGELLAFHAACAHNSFCISLILHRWLHLLDSEQVGLDMG